MPRADEGSSGGSAGGSNGGGGVGRRRNGKQQACEPCRRLKLACDHAAPFCGRCVRRKMTATCIYHPAPMTKERVVARPLPSAPPPSLFGGGGSVAGSVAGSGGTGSVGGGSTEPYTSPYTMTESSGPSSVPSGGTAAAAAGADSIQPSVESNRHSFSDPSSAVGIREYQSPEVAFGTRAQIQAGKITKITTTTPDHWNKTVFRRSSTYFGPTNFLAVFSENQEKEPIGKEHLMEVGYDGRKHPGAWVFGQPLMGRSREGAPTARYEMVNKVLLNIPSLGVCWELIDRRKGSLSTVINTVIIRHFITTLWATFDLEKPRTAENLLGLADALFRNEETPLPTDTEDGDGIDWLNTFIGPNIRFEMLGLFFSWVGLCYLALQDWDPLFVDPNNKGRDRRETAWRMKECTDVCLRMCDFTETVNVIVSAVQYTIICLESGCTGDESYRLRRRHGDMTVTAVAAGLHRLPDQRLTRVTAASETRRRVWCAIYAADKTHSSMNGVPPHLTQRYCDVQPPLDLTDDELFLPQHELAQAVARLDANGWNQAGRCHSSTRQRASLPLVQVREEVLEASLGVAVKVTKQTISQLYAKSERAFRMIPKQLRYQADGRIEEMDRDNLIYQSKLTLDYLQNRFLIGRIAMSQDPTDRQPLLDTAMEMMDMTVMLWVKRDWLTSRTSQFDWFVTFYGVPSAGVVCIELLKQSKQPSESDLIFSRSDAIQKLTLFIGFLEWIRPTDGNYKLATRLKRVVRSVLDYILEPQLHGGPSSSSSQQQPQHPTAAGFDPDFPDASNTTTFLDDPLLANLDLAEMDWLNSIDWTQGPWMELS